MANLTDSMTVLRDEIIGLRQNRDALRTELRHTVDTRRAGVLAWRSALVDDLTGARQAWAGLARKAGATEPVPAKEQPVVAVKLAGAPAASEPLAEHVAGEPAVGQEAAADHPTPQHHRSAGHEGGKRNRDRHQPESRTATP